MEACVRVLRLNRGGVGEDTIKLMNLIVTNILKDPMDARYRRLRLANKKLAKDLTAVHGAIYVLCALGFNLKRERCSELAKGAIQGVGIIKYEDVLVFGQDKSLEPLKEFVKVDTQCILRKACNGRENGKLIKFKLLDGSELTAVFFEDDTLASLYSFLRNHPATLYRTDFAVRTIRPISILEDSDTVKLGTLDNVLSTTLAVQSSKDVDTVIEATWSEKHRLLMEQDIRRKASLEKADQRDRERMVLEREAREHTLREFHYDRQERKEKDELKRQLRLKLENEDVKEEVVHK